MNPNDIASAADGLAELRGVACAHRDDLVARGIPADAATMLAVQMLQAGMPHFRCDADVAVAGVLDELCAYLDGLESYQRARWWHPRVWWAARNVDKLVRAWCAEQHPGGPGAAASTGIEIVFAEPGDGEAL